MTSAIVLVVLLASLQAEPATQRPGAPVTGSVRGTTVSSTVAPDLLLPGVTIVVLAASEDRILATTVSDSQGRFEITSLPPGTYRMRASLGGFSDCEMSLALAADRVTEMTMRLEIARVAERVDVLGAGDRTLPSTAAGVETLSGRMIDVAPLEGDNFQALLPVLPGAVRTADGRISMKGGQPTQTGFQVSSATVNDPFAGNLGFELPIDAIESVDVIANPYAAESGRFSTAVTEIHTRRGGDRWTVVPNGLLPWPDFHKRSDGWALTGIRSYTPRVAIGGPLGDRVSFAQTMRFRFVKNRTSSLSEAMRVTSFDSFTRLDARLGTRHVLVGHAAIYPRDIRFANLNSFNPPEVTADFRQRGYHLLASDRWTLGGSGLVESTVSFKRYDVRILPQRPGFMILTPEGNDGSYFNGQDRRTRSYQWLETMTLSREGRTGLHVMKIGLDLHDAAYTGTSNSQPVIVHRADGTMSERIEFTSPLVTQRGRGTDLGVFAQDRWRVGARVQMELGLRLDRDGVLRQWHASPRGGVVLGLLSDAKAVLRGGAGLFRERTPLNVGVFESSERRVVTRYGLDGATPLDGATVFEQRTAPDLQPPHSLTWNVELDARFSPTFLFKINHMDRRGSHEFVVEPQVTGAGSGVLLLGSGGRSRYRETELTLRWFRSDDMKLAFTYVRARSRADLNAYDAFFGNIRQPIVRANEFSITSVDVPNRLIVRGVLQVSRNWSVAPFLEVRNGFPYSIVDERQEFVGQRNLGGRFPAVATLDLDVQRPIRVGKWRARIGFAIFNILNRFTPREVQNNRDSIRFGSFLNPVNRAVRIRFYFE